MRPKIFVTAPSSRSINPYTMSSLMYNMWELGRQGVDISEPRAYDEYPISRARNAAKDDFLEAVEKEGYTHQWTWDDDQIFYKGTILKCLMAEQPIVSTWYLARKGNLGLVVFKRDPNKKLMNETDFSMYRPLTFKELVDRQSPDHPSLAMVDGIGLGGCLMTADAVRKMQDVCDETGLPMFAEWHPLMSPEVHHFGEDLWWSDVCAAAGVPIYVHLGAYVGHWAAQGFILGPEQAQAKAMQEGAVKFNLRELAKIA